MKAVSTFNSDKNIKLATYASRCIENEILMFIRKSASQKKEVSIDEPLSVDWDGNELLLSDVLGGEVDSVSKPMEEEEERRLIRADEPPTIKKEVEKWKNQFVICFRYH